MTDVSFTYRAIDEAATQRLGQTLAPRLPEGSVVALIGPLGAGKTRLVQAMAEACGVERRDVVSPTFVLVHEYHARRPVIHIDAYRVRDDDEFLALGVEEYFAPPNLVFVEWADRVADCLPQQRIEIAITVTGEDSREFRITGRGAAYAQLVERLRGELADQSEPTR